MRQLAAVGFLRAAAHDHFRLEHAARLAVEHGFHGFAAFAGRGGVIDHKREIAVLAPAQQHGAIEMSARALAAET